MSMDYPELIVRLKAAGLHASMQNDQQLACAGR
jgi:hypothetical protein